MTCIFLLGVCVGAGVRARAYVAYLSGPILRFWFHFGED